MDEDYNFYDEDINQPNWPKVVIALLLIVVAVASYFGYQKFIKGKEKTVPDYSISITDPLVQELYYRYNFFTETVTDFTLRMGSNLYGYYYLDSEYIPKTISPEAMLVTTFQELFNNQTLRNKEGDTSPLEIDGETVRKTMKELFGEDIVYEDQSLTEDDAYYCDRGTIVYHADTDMYQTEGDTLCSTTNTPIIKTKIKSAEKKDDTITIIDEMAYLVPTRDEDGAMQYEVYDSIDTNDLTYVDTVSTISEFAFYNYNHLHQYQYTFKKTGEEYQLTKVERIK